MKDVTEVELEEIFGIKNTRDSSLIEKEFKRYVKFLDGRDLNEIPEDEVDRLTGKRPIPLIKLALCYEIHRCKTDKTHFKSLEWRDFRDLWYEPVKPFLTRIEPFEVRDTAEWDRKRTKYLSKHLSDFVLSGFIRYEDLKVRDTTRPFERPDDYRKYHTGRFDEVILFIEKLDLFHKINNVARLLGITVEAGKGFQASSQIEPLISYLLEHPDRNYMVLVLTDYDFFGYEIHWDLIERIKILGLSVEAHRIGIYPEQIPKDKWGEKKYVLKSAKTPAQEQWLEKYGIEGKYGFELNALKGPALRGIIAEAFYRYCVVPDLHAYLKKNALDDVPSTVIDKLAEELGKEFVKQIEELQEQISALREKLDSLKEKLWKKFPENKLLQLAKDHDDRPEFPHDWLKNEVVEKTGEYSRLAHQKYTDTSKIEDEVFSSLEEEAKTIELEGE